MVAKTYIQPEIPNIPEARYNILDYDVNNKGTELNTSKIQKAVDEVSMNGGGTLVFSRGVYLSGTIELRSHVRILLEESAVILGSTERINYKKYERWFGLFIAKNLENVEIVGEGMIDGQGQQLAININESYHRGEFDSDFVFTEKRFRANEKERPQIIEMINCRKVKISGVVIKDAACWVQTYLKCQDLTIDSITVDSDVFWNNDGIDIENCQTVLIKNCDINAADDGVCLKSPAGGMNKDIEVINCRIRSSASAVKFGTDSYGGFYNIFIHDIFAYDTYRSAIALECVDGGIMEKIYVDNITAWNVGNAFFVRHGNRNGKPQHCKDIHISNITAYVTNERQDTKYNQQGPGRWFFHNPIPASITGIPGHPVDNVDLDNITLYYPGGATKGMAYISEHRLDQVLESVTDYPEYDMFQELPCWGLYVRHTDAVKLKDIKMRLVKDDFRSVIVFDDVKSVEANDISIDKLRKSKILVKDVESPKILLPANITTQFI